MTSERYTLGYAPPAVAFVDRRTADEHGAFILPHLRPDMRVLDCGCGPGSITLGLARRLASGSIDGVDADASQVAIAARQAAASGCGNARFQQASVYALPFADGAFDIVFSHALWEHLGEPVRAARECLRVLRPGGVIGIATPDWGGFLVDPMTPELAAAIRAYGEHLRRSGGNPDTGRALARIVTEAGFRDARARARFENYDPLTIIGEVMAHQAESAGQAGHAAAFRRWQQEPHGMWAQAWVCCTARKP